MMNFYKLHAHPSTLEGWDVPQVAITDGGNMESHYMNGILHRDGDLPAHVWVRHGKKDYMVASWFQNGKFHRDGDRPAGIERDEFRVKLSWFKDGVVTRDGAPAVVYYYRTASGDDWFRITASWYRDGLRVGTPRDWIDPEEHFGRTDLWAPDWRPENY